MNHAAMTNKLVVRVAWCVCILFEWTGAAMAADALLLDQLTDPGITLRDDVAVTLPRPIDLTGAVLAKSDLSGNFAWERFTKPSIVAPVWMDLDYIKSPDGERVGHAVHFRFIVHRSIDQLRDRNWMEGVFGGERDHVAKPNDDESQFEAVPDETLRSADVAVNVGREYGWVVTSLMNRVRLQGLIAGETSSEEGSVVLAWKLVDSIAATSKYAATWNAISRDEVGNAVTGPAESYRGCGGYLAIHSLAPMDQELAGACLVEGRIVMHEPSEWFGGSNFLRSKFPLLIQEAVRKFRRQLQQR